MTRPQDSARELSPRESRAWHAVFKVMLRTAPTPLMQFLRKRSASVPIEEVLITGRRTGKERRYLLTLVENDGQWYIGHPNGPTNWTRNLDATGTAVVLRRDGSRTVARPTLLPDGPERTAAIHGVGRQPFPAGAVYRAGRRHVLAAGRYYRLERDPVEG